MQSSLKKSLYLGLAALTFASVAGASVSATSTNANAAKHTTKKVAKKVTYKVTDGNLDQSVVYTATGSNAVYSKPGTVKGAKVVASKATMASLANSNQVSSQFMAYQEVTTSKGAKYLKVVSFDKKIRGYVYVSGVQKNDSALKDTSASFNFLDSNNNNTPIKVQLKSNRIFDKPYGTFGAKVVKLSSNEYKNVYVVDKAVTNVQGQTYFHITQVDANGNPVNGGLTGSSNTGWVNRDYVVANGSSDVFTNNTLTINFYDNATKKLIDTENVNMDTFKTNNGSGSTVPMDLFLNGSTTANAYSYNAVSSVVNSFVGTGNKLSNYSVIDTASNFYNYNNYNAKTAGSVVNAYVSHNDAKSAAAPISFKVVDGSNHVTAFTPVNLSDNKTAISGYPIDQFAAGLQGYVNDNFSLTNVVNNLFTDGKTYNKVYDAQGTEYVFNAAATYAANTGLYSVANGKDIANTFASVAGTNASGATAGSGITVVYTKVTTSGTTTPVIPYSAAQSNGKTAINIAH